MCVYIEKERENIIEGYKDSGLKNPIFAFFFFLLSCIVSFHSLMYSLRLFQNLISL